MESELLQAISREKGRSFLIQGGKRTPREDIMTSCVFGGLRYLPPEQSGIALGWIFPHLVRSGARLHDISFWPMKDGCEPDIVIDLITATDDRFRIIVEAKWMRYQLSADQLDKQWRIFGPSQLSAGSAVHVLLVEHRARVDREALEDAAPEVREFRHLMTWRDIAGALRHRKVSEGPRELNYWANDVLSVLNVAGQKPFAGWPTNNPGVTTNGSPIFFDENHNWWSNLDHDIDPKTQFFKK